jgi:hypothetical protein
MHNDVLLAQSRQQFLEQRKLVKANRNTLVYKVSINPNCQLKLNRSQCEFNLDSVHAVTNPLSQIIQSLAGSGVAISNIQTNLPASSTMYGSFSCGSAAKLGIESGLILSTGSVDSAKGPNHTTAMTGEHQPLPGFPNDGYPLLDALAGGDGHDAVWVSFDIVSNSDSIKFNYVFASEEYKEFVGSEFNDVFGFFISGPGITGTKNLAVLPNSNIPVTINSINPDSNSQYYIDNDYFEYLINGNQIPPSLDSARFFNLEYDGLTVVLTARTQVQPGQTYHLILAIEDVGDDILDAGVFIGAGSITSGSCTPSVTISANPASTICTGTNVTFTATPTNGGTPSYQWKLNGNNVGTNSNTYQNSVLVNGDVVSVVMTSSLACASPTTATSNAITMTVTAPVAPSVIIAANPSGTICAGTNVTFTATPTNGGVTPTYQWKLNGNNVGINSNTYSNNALANGDVVTVVMTSSLACVSPITATSTGITMVVTASVTPSVTISANPGNTICTGTNVTFTATPTNGGTPSYQWKLNGNNVGTNSNTYSNNALVNGDIVTVLMTSSLACASPITATSTGITMTVTATVTPSVTISANPGNTICTGTNVTFTATPTNEGTPSYQWKLNGSNVGTNSNTYSNNALVNGDIVTVVMTSSLACASPITATSTGITMIVTSTVAPSVTISASPGNTICTGTNVIFTATPTNGGTPSYQWKLNGNNVGTNSNTYSNSALANGDIVSVVMTSSLACANPTTATSNTITMVVTASVTPSVTISADPGNTICTGTNVTFTATPTNGGTPSYQWKLNGNNVGTNSNTYSNNALVNGDVVSVVMTSSLACASPTTATSNTIIMVVTASVTPLVTISANPGNTICTGTNVTFTGTPTNGGTPSYQWKLNGNNVGTNSNTYSNNALANGDVVSVVMTSSLACASPTTATSNTIPMVVTASVTPSVTISANPGNTICAGTNVTFTATPTNGGTPSYQWKLNSNNVGTNSNTYQNSTLANGDVVSVVMTSSLGCANPTFAISNEITMTVNPAVSAGTVSGVSPLCIGQTSMYASNGTSGGSWSSSNTSIATVNSSTGLVTALSAGTTNIMYTLVGSCNTVSASKMLTVNPNVSAGIVSGVTPLSVGATTLFSSTGTPGGSWSSTNNGIATVNASTGLVSAISAGTTNITYTVGSGCGSPVSAFQTLTVTNSTGIVSCGPKNTKILICHNGEEICVAAAAVPSHLDHGDIQGHCPTSKTIVTGENEPEKKLIVTAYPNPYETEFKLNIYSPLSGIATIEFYTISGVKIHEMKQNVIAGKSIVTDVKSLSSFTSSIIYKVSVGKYQTTGIIFSPSK